jgi:hypothetical protein
VLYQLDKTAVGDGALFPNPAVVEAKKSDKGRSAKISTKLDLVDNLERFVGISYWARVRLTKLFLRRCWPMSNESSTYTCPPYLTGHSYAREPLKPPSSQQCTVH